MLGDFLACYFYYLWSILVYGMGDGWMGIIKLLRSGHENLIDLSFI